MDKYRSQKVTPTMEMELHTVIPTSGWIINANEGLEYNRAEGGFHWSYYETWRGQRAYLRFLLPLVLISASSSLPTSQLNKWIYPSYRKTDHGHVIIMRSFERAILKAHRMFQTRKICCNLKTRTAILQTEPRVIRSCVQCLFNGCFDYCFIFFAVLTAVLLLLGT